MTPEQMAAFKELEKRGDLSPNQVAAFKEIQRRDEPESMLDVLEQAATNFPGSAVQLAKDVVTPFLHPIDTVKSIGNLGLGILENVIPGEQGFQAEAKTADAVGKFFVDRYGSLDAVKNTFKTDPAGFLADAATVLTGGGALTAKLPGIVGKTGRAAKAVGGAIDPTTVPLKAAGRVLNPKTKAAVKKLLDAGVTPTPGQVLGGSAKTIEDALTSVPLLGDVIKGGRARAQGQLNKAAFDRALNPIGETAKDLPIGPEGIAAVSDKLSAAYEALLPKLKLKPDAALGSEISDIVAKAKGLLPGKSAKQLEKIVTEQVAKRLSKNPEMSGAALKVLQTDIAKIVAPFAKGAGGSDQIIAQALGDIDTALRQAVIRSNPIHGKRLTAIDTGYANYARLRSAGKATGADLSTGFSPAQLRAAVKAEDKSLGKGDFARGRALMQDLSRAASEVLGPGVPDSGTVGRALLTGGLATGAVFDPTIASAAGLAALPFLPGGQRAAAAALTARPAPVRALGRGVSAAAPIGPAAFQAGRVQNQESQRSAAIEALIRSRLTAQ